VGDIVMAASSMFPSTVDGKVSSNDALSTTVLLGGVEPNPSFEDSDGEI
jgi:hypothetical protein